MTDRIDPAEVARLRAELAVLHELLPELAPLWNQAEEASELARENERLRALVAECADNPAIVAYKPELRARLKEELGK
jgi:hypothetical protein